MSTRPLLALTLLMAGCQTPWTIYDQSLYQAVAEPSEDTYAAHVRSLESMVQLDPIPPGMCAELAFYLILSERQAEAAAWLDREIELYPQSAKFVAELRSTLGLDTPTAEQQ